MTDPRPQEPAERRSEHLAPPAASARSVITDPSATDAAAAPGPTGHPAVDDVTAALGDLDGLPVDQHVAVFESAHDRLRAVLASGGASSAPTA